MVTKMKLVRYIPKDSVEVSTTSDGIAVAYKYDDTKGRPSAIGYKGKSNKPAFHNWFRTIEKRDTYVAEFIRKASEDYVNKLAAKKSKSEARKSFKHSFKVGDILHCSWGYDQTNCDFYQVVEVTDKSIWIREIGHTTVGPDGFMCTYLMPAKDKFLKNAPVMRKTVQNSWGEDYVTMSSYSSASKWDGKKKYSSWYA